MADSTVATRPPPAGSSGGYAPPPSSSSSSGGGGGTASVTRWLWIWITIAALVVVVVIGFLIGISNALASIDDNLLEARNAVAGGQEVEGVAQDVEPLPGQVQQVNSTLGGIDSELAAIPGQADQIIANLTSIRNSLQEVDSSLVDTSGSLQNTSGSLVDTSGVLQNVRGLAADIESVLEGAQAPSDNLGTSDIFMRVDTANGVLRPARNDTKNIVPQLVQVNEHLVSVCSALPLPGDC